MAKEFSLVSVLARWLFAAALVFGTYNPTEYSFVSWAFAEETEWGPVVAMAGIALLIAWIVFVRATFLSIGWLGIILGGAFFACLIWFFVDRGWLSLDSTTSMTWVILLLVSLILAVGLSWSHIRRKLTGQYDVDDIDD